VAVPKTSGFRTASHEEKTKGDRQFEWLFLGLGFCLRPGALAGDFVEELDAHALKALQRRPEVAGQGYIFWQKIIYLVEGEITLLSSDADETLRIFGFVFMVHPNLRIRRVLTRTASRLPFAGEAKAFLDQLKNK
jgi:hypothetical protein